MYFDNVESLFAHLNGVVSVSGDNVTVHNEEALPDKMDALVYSAVFSQGLVRDIARWLIWEVGQAIGVYPASIHELYMAVGSGQLPANFTVPAMNVRAMNYNMSRAIFRAANKYDVGAMLFEIARSEMGYTAQRPAEFTACLLAAAIKEGYRGPVFIQGDHIQVSASNYKKDAEAELSALRELMAECIDAGFYNIDIDTSTLVDLSFPTLAEQQNLNYTLCAGFTEHVRSLEPENITVSLGGEIGEVGHKNSTVEELHAFMNGYVAALPDGMAGISKISVQTGTSHGGVVLPDGTLADVTVDFDTLHDLGAAARDAFSCGGAVQHGASTLPPEAFGKFPEVGTLEIHLATGFQNIIFDELPQDVVATAYDRIRTALAKNWKEGKSEEQFIYSNRKRIIGHFKHDWWHLAAETQEKIAAALQTQFEFLFRQLNVMNTKRATISVTTQMTNHRARPTSTTEETVMEVAADLND